MVLSRVFDSLGVQSKARNAFVMGAFYAIIGIAVAFLFFPQHTGLVSVFFTSMAMMPPINKLIEQLVLMEGREKEIIEGNIKLTEFKVKGIKFSLRGLWDDHKHLILAYLFSFFGIFFVFSAFTLMLPSESQPVYSTEKYGGIIQLQYFNEKGEKVLLTSDKMFAEQVQVIKMITGQSATGFAAEETTDESEQNKTQFIKIIQNNLGVLIITLIVSIIFGFGAIFIIGWNASVWGIAFAQRALSFMPIAEANPLRYFIFIMLAVLPHTIAEAMAYLTAAISGAIASQSLTKEKIFDDRFFHLINQALIILIISILIVVIAAFLEVYALKYFVNIANIIVPVQR
ncbi:MAG: stage II sporulation protein M [Candidatus Diapherotrites archaeon]